VAENNHKQPMKISEYFGERRIITFTGLAKNAGKTTAMRTALAELTSNGQRCGVTSSGRDGESFDVLNHDIPKPQIFIPAGNLVATTDRLLAKSDVTSKRIESTSYRTPLGRVMIAEVLQSGNFEVAGPSTASGLKVIADRMLALGADRILLDGAINRQAAASPQVCEGVVLSTGAILNPDMVSVIEETRKRIAIYHLPKVEDPTIQEIFSTISTPTLVDQNHKATPIHAPSILDIGRIAAQQLKKSASWFLLPHAATEQLLEPLAQLKRTKRLKIIVSDATKILLPIHKLDFYHENGFDFQVIHPIDLLCVTANPVSPGAHRFDPDLFLSRLREALPHTPVLDVVSAAV